MIRRALDLTRLASPAVFLSFGLLACAGEVPSATGDSESGGAGASTSGSAGTATGGSAGKAANGGGGAGGSSGGASSTGGGGAAAGSAGSPSGGSGGAQEGPPVVIGACDGLGGVDEWEVATPPGVVFVGSVAPDPVNSGTVYVGTGAETGGPTQGIHKSTDCGATWTKVSTGQNQDILHSGTAYGIIVDWFEPNRLFTAMLYGINNSLLRSTNGGVDWSVLFQAGSEVQQTVNTVFAQEFSMDPLDHEHVVVSFHDACQGKYAPMCLGETHDSGETWHIFKGPLDGWGENARPYTISEKEVLFISYFGAYYTSDSSVDAPTWQKIADYGGHVYHAANGNYYLASYAGTKRSTDGGKTWNLIAGSPRGYGISGDGTRIFIGGDVPDNYYSALESDDTQWTKVDAPSTPAPYITLAYDAGHHLLYSANHQSGLLRMVTQ